MEYDEFLWVFWFLNYCPGDVVEGEDGGGTRLGMGGWFIVVGLLEVMRVVGTVCLLLLFTGAS